MSGPGQNDVQSQGHVCPAEHSGWLTLSARGLFNNPHRLLGGLVAEGDTAVDLGCGPGFFTLPLARLVGTTGKVVAVDVQEAMLTKLSERAQKAGLAGRIQLHLAQPGSLALDEATMTGRADFALAFWMVHEVPNKEIFLREVAGIMRPGGRFLLAEPRAHVPKAQYAATVGAAEAAGFSTLARPRTGFSHATLFRRS